MAMSSATGRFYLGDERPVRPLSPAPSKPHDVMLQKPLAATPIMTMNPCNAVARGAKKPFKSILKRPSLTGTSGEISSCSDSFECRRKEPRSVSFSGFSSSSRWDADITTSTPASQFSSSRSGKHKRAASHRSRASSRSSKAGNDSAFSNFNGHGNFDWSSPNSAHIQGRGRSPSTKSSCSPRLPRRDTSSVSPVRTKSSTLRPPRRRLSHENLFQHKIDFFLEQTAMHGKKLEQQEQQDGACSIPKDIEGLEMSLLSMQKFLVALHGVPNNQKLLQKHLDHQKSLQETLQMQMRQELQDGESDDGSMDYSEEDDEDEDEDEDDEALDKLYDELVRHRPLSALSSFARLGQEIFPVKEEEETTTQ